MRRKAEPRAEPLCHLAMPGENVAADRLAARQRAEHIEPAAQRRLAGMDFCNMPQQDRQQLLRLREIDRGGVLLERNFIAEQGGQRVGLGIAADIAHQREIEDLPHVFRTHAERVGEVDRQHAGAQGEIRRLAHR